MASDKKQNCFGIGDEVLINAKVLEAPSGFNTGPVTVRIKGSDSGMPFPQPEITINSQQVELVR